VLKIPPNPPPNTLACRSAEFIPVSSGIIGINSSVSGNKNPASVVGMAAIIGVIATGVINSGVIAG